MNYLHAPIAVINALICARLKDTSKVFGIVKQVRRALEKGVEIITTDLNGNQISIDDRYFVTLYHKVNKITPEVIGGRGKKTTYQLQAEMSLICSSKNEVVHDILLFILSQQKNITYTGSDFDFNSIIKQETGKSSVNFENCLFRIDYTIFHQSNSCLDECAMNDVLAAAHNDTDCIETSQGGSLTP